MVASSAIVGDESELATSSVKPSWLMQRLMPADVAKLRSIKSYTVRSKVSESEGEPVQQNWSRLLSRIQHVGSHIRDFKSKADEEDLRVQELLDQVRLDMKVASDRFRAAEQRALDIEERASRLIRVAEKRAEAAEHDRRLAQDRFTALSDLISQEFPVSD